MISQLPLNLDRHYNNHKQLELGIRTSSSNAKSLVNGLGRLIAEDQARTRGAAPLLIKAVGAIIGGLLKPDTDGQLQTWYQPMKAASFNGNEIGYRPFISAFRGLQALGMIDVQAGVQGINGVGGLATRIKASAGLIALAEGAGITPLPGLCTLS